MARNLIAILRGITPEEVEPIGEVLLEEGFGAIEVPLNSPDPFTSVARMVAAFGSCADIGAGTVLTVAEVEQLAELGAKLILSPNADGEVIARTRALGMQSWPGVMTPSECFTALKAGATGLKFFPGVMIEPAGLKAIKAVLPPEVPLYVVGGVGPNNFAAWQAAGANGFGLGTSLYTPGMTAQDVRLRARESILAYDALNG